MQGIMSKTIFLYFTVIEIGVTLYLLADLFLNYSIYDVTDFLVATTFILLVIMLGEKSKKDYIWLQDFFSKEKKHQKEIEN